ncbi:MAG TPA: NAD(P)-dependent oxidoreductase [Gemmataceae bacterium]|nr:NAD(P)-dependent oxidoreductase [Gemmataceae bacterium]
MVTGCTGFLGGAVVRELLAAGAEVVGLVRDRGMTVGLTGRVHIVRGRVEDTFRIYSALAVYEATAVFHLASANPNEPDHGTAAVVDAVRRYDPLTPIVMARPGGAPLGVSSPVPLGVAQFAELFGGGDRKTFRVVPSTILSLVTGDRTPLAGEGVARDFVFVRDAARAVLLLSESLASRSEPRVEALTFRSGWVLDDRAMAAAVRDVYDGRTPAVAPTELTLNPLGWSPAVSLRDGLAETIDWYREFLRARLFGTKPAGPPRRAAA